MAWTLKNNKPVREPKVEEEPVEEVEEFEEEIEEPVAKPVKNIAKAFKPAAATKTVKKRIVIVKELPMQPVRQQVTQDGTEITYYTIEEYLTLTANEDI